MTLEEIKTQNKNKIQKTAITLFAENGCEKTTFDMIAKESNLTRRTILNHFSSKDELMYTIYIQALEQAHEYFTDYILSEEFILLNGRDQFLRLIYYLLLSGVKQHKYVTMMTEMEMILCINDKFDYKNLIEKPIVSITNKMIDSIIKGKEDKTINEKISSDFDAVYQIAINVRGLFLQYAFFMSASLQTNMIDDMIDKQIKWYNRII